MAKRQKLPPKQKAFAEEYISNGANAYQAALKAGYAQSTAKSRSYELLRNPQIMDYISARRKELAAQTISPERVLLELADIGFGQREYPAYDMSGEEYQRKPSMTARLKALELMAKNQGLLESSQNRDSDTEVQIIDDVPPE